jgi:hypothetical protein
MGYKFFILRFNHFPWLLVEFFFTILGNFVPNEESEENDENECNLVPEKSSYNTWKQFFYLKAIELNPNAIEAYFHLGKDLPQNGTIQLNDKTIMTKQELFLKVIELKPNYYMAYFHLGVTLTEGGSIKSTMEQ